MMWVYSQYLFVSFTFGCLKMSGPWGHQQTLTALTILTWCPHPGFILAQTWAPGPFKSFLVSIPILILVTSLASRVGIGPMLSGLVSKGLFLPCSLCSSLVLTPLSGLAFAIPDIRIRGKPAADLHIGYVVINEFDLGIDIKMRTYWLCYNERFFIFAVLFSPFFFLPVFLIQNCLLILMHL